MSPGESSGLLKVLRCHVRSLTTLLERSHVDMIGKVHREKGERERPSYSNSCPRGPVEHRHPAISTQASIYFCFIDYAKAFDFVDHNKLWKILKMGIPDHLTCLLSNLYAGQETTVRTAHGTTDWFQIRKEVCQGCILSPCLFNLYVEYIMRNAGLEEAQTGIKIAGRNINNLRYADDTTLMTESEELKNL